MSDDCGVQPCESVIRWSLEHRGFTPMFAKSCKAHLADVIERLIIDNYDSGGVWVHKWGSW